MAESLMFLICVLVSILGILLLVGIFLEIILRKVTDLIVDECKENGHDYSGKDHDICDICGEPRK